MTLFKLKLSLAKNIINQIFNRSLIILFNQGSIFLIITILANRLDLNNFGLLSASMIMIQLGWIVSNFGLINSSIEFMQKNKTNNEKNNFISFSLIQIFLLALLYISFLFILINLDLISFPLKLLTFIVPSILIGSFICQWFFQAINEPEHLVKITFLSRLLFLTITFFYINENNFFYFFFFQALSLAIVASFSIFHIVKIKKFPITKIKLQYFKRMFTSQTTFFFNHILNSQINLVWAFFASLSLSPSSISFYFIGDQLFRSAGIFTNIISQVIRSNTINRSNHDLMIILKRTSLFYVLLLIILLSSVYLFYYYLLPDYYIEGINISFLFIIAWFIQAFIKILNYPVLGRIHGYSWVNKIAVKFLFLHIFLIIIWNFKINSVFFIPKFLILALLIQLIYFVFVCFKKTSR